MKVVAKSIKGQEFFYKASTAHKVSDRSANLICKSLNDCKFRLNDDEVWFVHDVGYYDNAYDYAQYQSFIRRNHKLVELSY